MYYILNNLLQVIKRNEEKRIRRKVRKGFQPEQARVVVFWEDSFALGSAVGIISTIIIVLIVRYWGA